MIEYQNCVVQCGIDTVNQNRELHLGLLENFFNFVIYQKLMSSPSMGPKWF